MGTETTGWLERWLAAGVTLLNPIARLLDRALGRIGSTIGSVVRYVHRQSGRTLTVVAAAALAVMTAATFWLPWLLGPIGSTTYLLAITGWWALRYRLDADASLRRHLWRNAEVSVAGVGLVVGAALLLMLAARGDHQWLGVIGVALFVAGLLALARAIAYEPVDHCDADDIASPDEFTANGIGIVLNVGTLAVPAVAVNLFLDVPYLVVAIVVALWLGNTYLARWMRTGPRNRLHLAAAGFGAVAAAVSLSWSIGSALAVLTFSALALAVLLGCVVFVSIWAVNNPNAHARLHWLTAPMVRVVPLVIAVVGVGWAVAVWSRSGWLDAGAVPMLVAAAVLGTAFGATFVLRGEGFALATAVGFAAVWSLGSAAGVDADPAARPAVVVLGDSYASGEGAPTYLAGTDDLDGNQCRRAPTAYGPLVADSEALSFSADKDGVVFVACSGARAINIHQTAQVGSGASTPQLAAAAGLDPDLVLVSIGGNDALFAEIGKTCVLPLDCLGADDGVLEEIIVDNFPTVRNAVSAALSAVRDSFPDAHIVVVPYPEMLDASDPECAGTPLSYPEIERLSVLVADINTAVADGVNASNSDAIWFDGGRHAYAEREICSASTEPSTMNLIDLQPSHSDRLATRMRPDTWVHNSFHPTPEGHRLMADAVIGFIADGCEIDGRPRCPRLAGDTPNPDAADDAPLPDKPLDATLLCDYQACKQRVVDVQLTTLVDIYRRVLPPTITWVLAGWLWALIAVLRQRLVT